MKDLNLSITKSLDSTDNNLLSFLPHLLQDLWEIGSDPPIIVRLLKKYRCLNLNSKVLDLGCGKGAVSVNIAKEFECEVCGIDAMPAFIEEANFWADKFHQTHLCRFDVGDIRERISELIEFDLIVLGSIGQVLGNINTTLKSIRPALSKNGYVILDDGYIPQDSNFENKNYLKQSEAEKQIKEAGYRIIEEFILENDFIEKSDADIYQKIKKRAQELIKNYPQKKHLFEAYLENQRIENDILENKVISATWLLQKFD